MKYIKEYIDFEDWDWEEGDDKKIVIVFQSGSKLYVGEIIILHEYRWDDKQLRYRVKLLDDNSLNYYMMAVIHILNDYNNQLISKSRGDTTLEELEKEYNVVIVDSKEKLEDIKNNPEKYINK